MFYIPKSVYMHKSCVVDHQNNSYIQTYALGSYFGSDFI